VGAAVLTEGIETVDELRALVNLGVNYGQGYLLGRPGRIDLTAHERAGT
jgi:EAL domain-containing protein (putative c-di-GMP-specific phosphodiesterase class I)